MPTSTPSALSTRTVDASNRREYDFYGLGVAVCTNDERTATSVHRDWKHFEPREGRAGVALELGLHRAPPDFDAIPELNAALITPRNVCYRADGLEYLDYFGRGLAIIDRARGSVDVWAEDTDLLREIAYLFLLSTVGEHLDGIGRHRVHALGISHRGRGILLLLPVGGGKSTMALRLLERPDIDLLSEDTPLLDSRGTLYPFPLRLGFREGNEPEIPPRYMQKVRRMEFGPKTLVDLEYFGGRVARPCPVAAVMVGTRSSGTSSRIERVGRRVVFHELVANLVVGIGVYQGLEFVIQRSWWELARKVRPALSRLYCGLQLLRRARPYRFVLGRDSESNFRRLEEFLENDLEP